MAGIGEGAYSTLNPPLQRSRGTSRHVMRRMQHFTPTWLLRLGGRVNPSAPPFFLNPFMNGIGGTNLTGGGKPEE